MVSVRPEDIGKCQHCKKVVCIYDIPETAWNDRSTGALVPCPNCRKLTDPWQTWGRGFDRDAKRSVRRYVGLRGTWVKHKPRRDYRLGRYLVKARPIRAPRAKRPKDWPESTAP